MSSGATAGIVPSPLSFRIFLNLSNLEINDFAKVPSGQSADNPLMRFGKILHRMPEKGELASDEESPVEKYYRPTFIQKPNPEAKADEGKLVRLDVKVLSCVYILCIPHMCLQLRLQQVTALSVLTVECIARLGLMFIQSKHFLSGLTRYLLVTSKPVSTL